MVSVTKESCFMGKPSHVASYWRQGIAPRAISGVFFLLCRRSSADIKTVAALSVAPSIQLYVFQLLSDEH